MAQVNTDIEEERTIKNNINESAMDETSFKTEVKKEIVSESDSDEYVINETMNLKTQVKQEFIYIKNEIVSDGECGNESLMNETSENLKSEFKEEKETNIICNCTKLSNNPMCQKHSHFQESSSIEDSTEHSKPKNTCTETSETDPERPHACTICEKRYFRKGDLTKHYRVHTEGRELYKCSDCGKEYPTSYSLEIHRRIHTGEKPYGCTNCEKKFRIASDLKLHQRVHTGEKPFQCNQCPKKFIQASFLKEHLLSHTGEKPYVCNLCGFRTMWSFSLKKHVQIIHGLDKFSQEYPKKVRKAFPKNREREFKCDLCPKQFTTEYRLSSHMKEHSDELMCAQCGRECANSSELKSHGCTNTGTNPLEEANVTEPQSIVGATARPLKFKCNLCPKQYAAAFNLRAHKKVHTGVGLLTCEHCGKQFTCANHLKTHVVVHSTEKRFVCNTCGKRFLRSSDVNIHQRIHTQEKPFKCEFCDKDFTTSSGLQVHRRIHTGEKPYVCKVCGKGFRQAGDIKLHQRIHTGEKPHQCELCNKKFAQYGALRSHLRFHSGERPHACTLCNYRSVQLFSLKKHISTMHRPDRPTLRASSPDDTDTQSVNKKFECDICQKQFTTKYRLRTHKDGTCRKHVSPVQTQMDVAEVKKEVEEVPSILYNILKTDSTE